MLPLHTAEPYAASDLAIGGGLILALAGLCVLLYLLILNRRKASGESSDDGQVDQAAN